MSKKKVRTHRMRRRKQHMDIISTTFKDAYKTFMAEKRAMNLSEQTLETYKLHIESFLEYNDLYECTTPVLCIDMYLWWIEDMQQDPKKKAVTVASYCRSVRAFIYWLQDNNFCLEFHMSIPKYQKEIKETYTDEELAILLEKPNEKECSEVDYQTWVFINLIVATGLRLSSALNIKVASYVPKDKKIYVQMTKNKKGQVTYINDEMSRILNQYIKRFELTNNDYMFCTAEGTPLAKRTMQDNVATYNRKNGVNKTSIHLMRHTFAKNYYEKTKDIYTLCHMLGHSNIGITENYLQDLGVKMENATAYNPQQQYAKESQKKTRRGKLK